jgi:Tfp pilus assembly protein PilV
MRRTVTKNGFTPLEIGRWRRPSALGVSLTGFTLVEVIMAAALLTIAIVPILKALTEANMNTAIIERRTQSLCLAQGKLNQIKAESIYNFDGIPSDSNEVLSGSYLCNTTSQMVSGSSNNLKAITVSVGRLDGSGTLMSDEVTLQTQIARRW